MRFIITFLMLVSLVLSNYGNSANSKVKEVTIYHSGALVNREISTDVSAGVTELRIENISSKLVLNSIKIANPEITILNKTLLKKLTKEELARLTDKRDALNNQLSLIEAKYSESGFITEVEDLQKMSEFYTVTVTKIKQEIRSIEGEISNAKKLESIKLKNKDAAILVLNISTETNINENVELSYVCGGIGWSPSYEITVESSKENKLNLKYLAKIMSQTGEDWDNVKINLSSSFPLEPPTNLPSAENPWVLDGRSTQRVNIESYENQGNQNEIEKLEGVEYNEIKIPSHLGLRSLESNYSLKSNSTVFTFPIDKMTLPANFYYYGFPYLDPEVYLVAKVTGWNSLGLVDGVANITYGNNNVGNSVVKFSSFKDTLLLPIAKDNSVYMRYTEISDQKYFETASIGKKKTTTLAYKYELKNNNAFPINFELVDQVPLSQTKLAEVEIIKQSKAKVDEKTGEVLWSFTLDAAEEIDKELIYKIETDGSYRYNSKSKSARAYRTISCPSF